MQSAVDELLSQFIAYEQTEVQVEHILQHWDRAQLMLMVALPTEDAQLVTEDVSREKQVSLLTTNSIPKKFGGDDVVVMMILTGYLLLSGCFKMLL